MSICLNGNVRVTKVFQFQNGTIMSTGCVAQNPYATRISIPKWYDYEIRPNLPKVMPIYISIPKWYDYEPRKISIEDVILIFQFQNGTIMRLSICNPIDCPVVFQFQNGTIKSPALSAKHLPRKHFNSKMVRLRGYAGLFKHVLRFISIPKWYD